MDWILLGILAISSTLLPLALVAPHPRDPLALRGGDDDHDHEHNHITITLEPVYGIVLAYLLWSEEERLATRFGVRKGR